MNQQEMDFLIKKCRRIRYLTIDEIASLGVGHAGGSMSMIEALVVLYYRHMRIDPGNPKMEGRDRFVLSKGHAGPALYAILADKGYLDLEVLHTLNRPGTSLPSHADMVRTKGVDMTTGSLGQGLSCAVGIAIGSELCCDGAFTYVVVGDGECDEGQIWEAAMYAAHKKLGRLIVFVDYNKMQLDGETEEINSLEPFEDKWKAFGWDVYRVPGHDIEAIDHAVYLAKACSYKPSVIILDTVKGKGVGFLEERWKNNHNVTISSKERDIALKELGEEA